MFSLSVQGLETLEKTYLFLDLIQGLEILEFYRVILVSREFYGGQFSYYYCPICHDEYQQKRQAGNRSKQAGSRSKQAGNKSKQADSRSKQADSRSKQAGSRSKQAGSRCKQVGSRSKQAGIRSKHYVVIGTGKANV